MFAIDDYAACSLPILFPLRRYCTIRKLEFCRDMLLQTVFFDPLRNFRWLNPSAVRNLIIMLCSTLTDTFCSLISLVELRHDCISSQLHEREGREATPLSRVSNVLVGVLLS